MKLIYFNLKGRAELARLILAQAEVGYEDCRISREEWQTVKPSKTQSVSQTALTPLCSHAPGSAAPPGGGGGESGTECRHSSLSRPQTRTGWQDGDCSRPGGHGHRHSGRPDGARGGHDEGEG